MCGRVVAKTNEYHDYSMNINTAKRWTSAYGQHLFDSFTVARNQMANFRNFTKTAQESKLFNFI